MIAPGIENETQLIDHSKYYDDTSFSDVLKHSNNRLSMISLNKNKKRKDEPLSFKCNGRDLTDDIEIANEFNRFFADIGESLASNMEQFDNHELNYKPISKHLMHRIVNFSLLMKMQQLKP